jgi:cytochrome b561
MMDAGRASARYGGTAIALHWLTAALIVANLALGLSMVPLPFSPQKLKWYQWHKWIGVTVFLVTTLRLLWRWRHPAPTPAAMPLWQQKAAAVAHSMLYVLLLAIPVSGWLYSSSTGVQVVYLGLVPLPDLMPKDKTLAAALKAVHLTLNFTMFAVVCLHAAAALKHHFVDHDGVLQRMLPLPRPKGPPI